MLATLPYKLLRNDLYDWRFELNAPPIIEPRVQPQQHYLHRLRTQWDPDKLCLPSSWMYPNAYPEPTPDGIRPQQRDKFVFSLLVSPMLPEITLLDDQQVRTRPATELLCPDFALCARRTHDPSYKDKTKDPTAHCLELAITGFLYFGSEAMAEYSVSTLFTGIPGCWMRRTPSTSLSVDTSSDKNMQDTDFAVLLHQYGSSAHCQVDRDSNLQISPTHPALLVALKGPDPWPESGSRATVLTLADALRSLARRVQPSLEALLAALYERDPAMASVPDFAVIFGVVYDATRLHVVAHMPVTDAAHHGPHCESNTASSYRYVSQVVDTFDFPSHSESFDKRWCRHRLRLFYALMTLRRHVHRLSAIWDGLPPARRVWDAEDLRELAVMGPLCIPPPSESAHSDDICEDCFREECACEDVSGESDTCTSDGGQIDSRVLDKTKILKWLANVAIPGDTICSPLAERTARKNESISSRARTPDDDVYDFLTKSTAHDEQLSRCEVISSEPLERFSHWSIEHKDYPDFPANGKHVLRSHIFEIVRHFPRIKKGQFSLPETFKLSPTDHSVPGSAGYGLDALYRYGVFEVKLYMIKSFRFVSEEDHRAQSGSQDAVDNYTGADAYINRHPDLDTRSLKHALMALLVHHLPISFEVPIECLVARVVHGFLEIPGCRVIRDADHRARLPQPLGIVRDCESAVSTEMLIPDLTEDIAIIVLAVLPWDSRPIKLAQERLALRIERILRLILYLYRREIAAVQPENDRSAALPKWCCLMGAIYTRTGIVFVAHWPEWLIQEKRWRFVSSIIDEDEAMEWTTLRPGCQAGCVALRLLRMQYHASYIVDQIRRLVSEQGVPHVDDILFFPLES